MNAAVEVLPKSNAVMMTKYASIIRNAARKRGPLWKVAVLRAEIFAVAAMTLLLQSALIAVLLERVAWIINVVLWAKSVEISAALLQRVVWMGSVAPPVNPS